MKFFVNLSGRWARLLMVILPLLVGISLGFAAGARYGRRASVRAVVATVNGENLSKAELDGAFQLLSGEQTIRFLCLQKVILQEAKKSQLTLSEDELSEGKAAGLPAGIASAASFDKDSVTALIYDQELQAQLFLRKMVLKDVPDQWKRHVYELFRAELTQFELSCIPVGTQQDADSCSEDLERGVKFEKLAKTYSRDVELGKAEGKLGWLTAPTVQAAFGEEAWLALMERKPGTVWRVDETPFGPMFFRVRGVRDKYEDLEPSIEDLFVAAKSMGLMQKLLTSAQLSTPYQFELNPQKPSLDPKSAASPSKTR